MKTAKSGKGVRLVSLLLAAMMVIGMLVVLPITSAAEDAAPQVAITTISGNSNSNYIGYAETNFGVNSDFYFFNNKAYTESNPDAVRASGTYKFMYAAPASGASGNLPKMVLGYNSTNYTMKAGSYFSGTTTKATQRGIGYQGAVFTNNTTKAQYAIVQGLFDIQWSKYTLAPNATQTTFTGAVEELVAAVQDVAGTKIPVIVSIYSTGDTTPLAELLPSGVSLLSVNTDQLNSFVFGMNGVSLDGSGSMTGKFSGSPYSRNLFTMPALGAKRTVKFFVDGAQVGETLTVPDGSDVSADAPTPVKTGFRFLGWYDSTLTEEVDLTNITADTNAYAKFEAATTYTVTFLDKDGNNVVDPQIIVEGEDAVVPNAPAVADSVFLGWYAYDGEMTDTEVTDFTNVQADITVQAKYRAGMEITLNSAQDFVDFLYEGAPDTYVLGGNIDMTGTAWTPINFAKSFNGNGYTISNLSDSLFNKLSGTVTNVKFDKCKSYNTGRNAGIVAVSATADAVITYVDVTNSEIYGTQAGAIVGSIDYTANVQALIENCTVDANTTVGANGNNRQTGGFVGDAGNVYINKCTSAAVVTGKNASHTGGFIGRVANSAKVIIEESSFVGTATADASSAGVGGFIGNIYGAGATIINCESNGTVGATGSATGDNIGLGGFVGNTDGGSSGRESQFTISDSNNYTTISFLDTEHETKVYAGGFVGRAQVVKTVDTITNCVNYADITAKYAGGFVGGFTNTGFVGDLVLDTCINEGTIAHNTEDGYASELIAIVSGGAIKTVTVKDCVVEGDLATAAGAIEFNGLENPFVAKLNDTAFGKYTLAVTYAIVDNGETRQVFLGTSYDNITGIIEVKEINPSDPITTQVADMNENAKNTGTAPYAVQKIDGVQTIVSIKEKKLDAGAMILGSDVALLLKVNKSFIPGIDDVAVKVGGKTLAAEVIDEGDYFTLKITDLKPADLGTDKDFVVVFTFNGAEYTADVATSYSPVTYATNMYAKTQDTTLKNLLAAFVNYTIKAGAEVAPLAGVPAYTTDNLPEDSANISEINDYMLIGASLTEKVKLLPVPVSETTTKAVFSFKDSDGTTNLEIQGINNFYVGGKEDGVVGFFNSTDLFYPLTIEVWGNVEVEDVDGEGNGLGTFHNEEQMLDTFTTSLGYILDCFKNDASREQTERDLAEATAIYMRALYEYAFQQANK